jgi:hypothetical protein
MSSASSNLRDLLFGRQFSQRTAKTLKKDSKALNQLIRDLLSFLKTEHTDEYGSISEAYYQAETELTAVRKLPNDSETAISCKRAVVLFALAREPQIQSRWISASHKDFVFLTDLCSRVLPIATPSYVNSLGQRPDLYVAMCATMSVLWMFEPLCIGQQ